MPLLYVIEDNEALALNLRVLLELHGFEVRTFGGGVAAWQALRQRLPDLVLCDILMPDLDGLDLLCQTRELPDGDLLPFVFLSALAEVDQIREGMGLGADDYIVKPFKPDTLLQAVTARLARAATLRRRLASATVELDEITLRALPDELSHPVAELTSQAARLETLELEPALSNVAAAIADTSWRMKDTLTRYRTYLALKSGRIAGHEPVLTNLGEAAAAVAGRVAARRDRTGDLLITVPRLQALICRASLDLVMFELCKNAFDFTPPGSPVEVAGGFRGRDPYLAIRDSGPGMTQAQIDRIGPFQRAHGHPQNPTGTGLGLAICRLVAGLHHWRLDFGPARGRPAPVRDWEDVWDWEAAAQPAPDGFAVEITIPSTV